MNEGQGDEVTVPGLPGTGAGLAAALAAAVAGISELELSEASRGQLVEIAVAAEKVKAWAVAAQASATNALIEQFETDQEPVSSHDRDRAHDLALEATSLSLSLALGISLRAADQKICLALGLDAHPDLAAALDAGRIHELHATAISQATIGLAAADADRLVAAVITNPTNTHPTGATSDADPRPVLVRELRDGTRTVWSIPAHQLRPILTRTIAEIAPDRVQSETQARHRGRHVAHYASTPGRDGALVLHGPDHLLAAMYTQLDLKARAARNAGAAETLDQLRFDLAAGSITDSAHGLSLTYTHTDPAAETTTTSPPGQPLRPPRPPRPPQPPRPRRTTLINITVPDTTLLGLDHHPAVLHTPSGDVPIPAQLARELAHQPNSTWRRILCDPATGTATDVSPGYTPGTRIAELCKVRDGHTTRFPTSTTRTLELDHIHEYDHTTPAAGGPTTATNLAAAGKRDHQAKTDRILDVTGNANHVLTYTTGTGHTHTSTPHQYLDPRPPPPRPRPPEAPDNGDPPY